MSKISIVGVDGSGKTVLMAAFGEKYSRPDNYGYFLSANTPQTFHTVTMLMSRMRHGQWPNATGTDAVTNLDWKLFRRSEDANELICSVSFLDYAGEIYRLAFGEHTEEERQSFKESIGKLQKHISSSDALLVLINLKDVISGDLLQVKTRETLWISRSIFDYAAEKNPGMKMALAFSQADIYREEIEQAGGLRETYQKYLSHIECLYPNMQLLSVSAVNRTTVNAEGFEIPAEDFGSEGLESVLEWIVSTVPGHEGDIAYRRNLPGVLWGKLVNGRRLIASGSVQSNAERLRMLEELAGDFESFRKLPEDESLSVASKDQMDEMADALAGAIANAKAFESVLAVARKQGAEAAKVALDRVVARGCCTEGELMRLREEIARCVAVARAAAKKTRARKRKLKVAAALLIAAGVLTGCFLTIGVEGLQRCGSGIAAWFCRLTGKTEAYYEQARAYTTGDGISRDYIEAARLYRCAADWGDVKSQYELAGFYYSGTGVNQNDAEAARLYRLAAEQGHTDALFKLGAMYAAGKGVEQNDVEAAALYRLSANQGNVDAQIRLGDMYRQGKGIEQNNAEAARFYRLAAERGNKEAQFLLGDLYRQGAGVEQSDGEAARLYRLSADQGHAAAQYFLAMLYRRGAGVARDDREALRLFRLSAAQGNADAQYRLGGMYYTGTGEKQDYAEAARYFRLAADQGHAKARFNLALLYEKGRGVELNPQEAARFYRLAAEQNDPDAQFNLARMYLAGDGVDGDKTEALRLLKCAAENGNESARQWLNEAGYSR